MPYFAWAGVEVYSLGVVSDPKNKIPKEDKP